MSSNAVYLEELAYSPDSCALFERISELANPVFFDSAYPHSHFGRFDILTAAPIQVFSFNCHISDTYDGIRDFISSLDATHKALFGGTTAPAEDIPFCGGIAGYMDYGLGKPMQHLRAEPGCGARFGAYNWAVVQDHLLQRCTFAALPSLNTGARADILSRLRAPVPEAASHFSLREKFRSNLSHANYQDAFKQIQGYILSGDCYQVNLARRFSTHYEGDPWRAYQMLRPLAAAPYSGFMRTEAGPDVLCLSPERFLQLHGKHVETRPIKGTRPRHRDRRTDKLAAAELQRSAKDRAENLMIVDLLRNDIGKGCVAGSVHVDRLFELESYPTVHHLVSTISGELLPNHSAWDLLQDCFPGGSITGAPKRRAMEIIDELEPDSRQAYCGSLVYISADGRMDSNIAIRTLLCEQGAMHCWGGGGIVADSDGEKEYQETWDKVGRFLQALETTLPDATS